MLKYFIFIFIILTSILYTQYNIANKYDISKEEDRLFIYSENGNYDGVKELLKNGIDVNILDSDKISPLMLASFNGHEDIVDLLIKKWC
ncbi:ankyrin repeat domain-containing protein [uncultured Brachyspira sp.]|uniref:ankyrin repeat domain-containing protein n=1 Tax=uncultured Brachyspira sp. TaxID=221953 RepID=UPI00260F3F5E|nr:ankyrin repeat domain-containing protein [uncultured Brachyspira sp.]